MKTTTTPVNPGLGLVDARQETAGVFWLEGVHLFWCPAAFSDTGIAFDAHNAVVVDETDDTRRGWPEGTVVQARELLLERELYPHERARP